MKKDKNRKLHGSVLLTVVFVMAILIVFLFGTMSLAIAANNRSHVNYSSAQTQITARTVAESAIKAIGNSSDLGEDYANAVAGLKAGEELTVGVQLSSDAENRIGTMGNVSDVTISHYGTTQYYDPILEKWDSRDVLKFTATVDMAGVQSTSSVYVIKYKEDDIKTGRGGGAGFVTTADANLDTQTSIFGGAYITLPTEKDAADYENYYLEPDYEKRMATRTFRKPDSGIEKLKLFNSQAVIEADLFINNDVHIENWSGIIFPDKGTGITIWGDLDFSINARDQFHYIMNKGLSENMQFNKIPYIYVDGKISGKDGFVMLGNATQSFPMNTFCASIDSSHADSIISSNLYCMDEGLESSIKGGITPGLYNWTGSVVNKVNSTLRETQVKGEICSKGDLRLENVTINGDVRVEGKLTIVGDKVEINGNVVAGEIDGADKIELGNGYSIYCDGLESGGADSVTATFDNQVGFYYVYKPQMDAQAKYTTKDGKILNDSVFINGVLREGYQINDIVIYHTLEEGWNPTMDGAEQHFTKSSLDENNPYIEDLDYYYSIGGSSSAELQKYLIEHDLAITALEKHLEEGAGYYPDEVAGFYVKTKAVDIAVADGDMEGYESIIVDETEYKFKYEIEYEKVEEATFEQVVVAGESGNSYEPVSEFYNKAKEDKDSIYPFYAERAVVLGKDTSIANIEENKVVMTVADVMNTVSNPYASNELPAGQKTKYQSLLASGPEFKNKEQIAAVNGVMVTTNGAADYSFGGQSYRLAFSTDKEFEKDQWDDELKGNKKVHDKDKWKNEVENNSAAYITDSCILNGVNFGNKDVIINPEGKEIVIVIRGKVTFDSSSDVFIDNSAGGKVFFYIEPKNGDLVSHLEFRGTNLATKTYWEALDKSRNFSFKSTEKGPEYQKLEDLGDGKKPNVYIYGGEDSKMDILNMSLMTAYVKSPNISTWLGGGTATQLDSFYYNDFDVVNGGNGVAHDVKQTIIGCFNVEDVKSENQLNVVYIPEEGGDDDGTGEKFNNYWYKPYYYSEF